MLPNLTSLILTSASFFLFLALLDLSPSFGAVSYVESRTPGVRATCKLLYTIQAFVPLWSSLYLYLIRRYRSYRGLMVSLARGHGGSLEPNYVHTIIASLCLCIYIYRDDVWVFYTFRSRFQYRSRF